ncbi:MAG: DUF305 domain-containing protein [Pseudonocardiaceae bacterium]
MADAGNREPSAVPPSVPPRWRQLLLGAAATLTVLLFGGVLGIYVQSTRGAPAGPAAGTVEVGFPQDMSVHHRQAVLMAGIARDRSTDPAIRSLAFDIETGQLEQIGRMQGWLSLWNAAPLPIGRRMTWMADASSMHGMAHHDGSGSAGVATMPGMASPADLHRLREAIGTPFDVLFLQLMLRHHQGGVPMARYAGEHSETAQVRNLAEKMALSQSAESRYLAQMIAQRGAVPLSPPS